MSAQDIAILIGAVAAALVTVSGAAGALWLKFEQTHKAINSALERFVRESKELSDAEAKIARLEGVRDGVAAERKEPMAPATIVVETVLTKERELTESKMAELKAKVKRAKRKPAA